MLYIIELSEPLCHAKFYVGYCCSWRLDDRIKEHRLGRGAKLLKACCERQITFRVIATHETGNRALERQIKRQKNTPRLVREIKNGKRPEWRLWRTKREVLYESV